MQRESFFKLFETALHTAATNTERAFSVQVPRNFRIELFNASYRGLLVNMDTAVNGLYISTTQFYPIIDISIKEVNNDEHICTASARVGEGILVPFEHTFNYANGMGPFKQVLPYQLKVVSAQYINLPANFREKF
jgi:hypothetical protein